MSGTHKGGRRVNREYVVALADPIAVSDSFSRPANTTAYASGDLVANSTTAGSVVPLSWVIGTANGYSATITHVRLHKDDNDTSGALFRLHLYKASPTPANGDNGAFSTDESANYLGSYDLSSMQGFTDGDVGIMTPNEGTFRTLTLGDGNTTIYGLLEARGAYTPASGETFTVTLEGYRD